MHNSQLEALITNFSLSSIEGLKLLLSNSKTERNCETTKLFNGIKIIKNIL